MNLKKRRKYWKYFIYFICGIMLIFPYSETFTTEYDDINGDWIKNYALNSFEYAIAIIPLIILLIMVPRIENRGAKKILIVILCLLSGIAFLFAFQSLTMPIQDFVPQWGMLILIILFPIVAIDSLIEWKRQRETLQEVE
jgi:predicted neutral ceramidase superfamily lipid hydrolase